MNLENCAAYQQLSAHIIQPYSHSDFFFHGIMIYDGFGHSSSVSFDQYRTYCPHAGRTERFNQNNVTKCRFGILSTSSVGTVTITFPLKHVFLKVTIHINDADAALLLLIGDMDKCRIIFANLESWALP